MYKAKIMTSVGIGYLEISDGWFQNSLKLLAAKQWEDALANMVNENPSEKLILWILRRQQSSLTMQSTAMQQYALDIELWLKERDDKRRWRILDQAEMLGFDTALGALGLSLFWMQGSMTQAEFEAVYPEKHLSQLMLHCSFKLLSISLSAEDEPTVGAQVLISEWNTLQGNF